MLATKQELSVKVAEVDSVKVYNMDLPEAGEDQVLEKFASDATRADQKNARLQVISA